MKPCALIDIDGTLVDRNEQPIQPVIDLVRKATHGLQPVFATSRNGLERGKTDALIQEILDYASGDYIMLMRAATDTRSGLSVKQTFLTHLRAMKMKPVIAFENDPAVCQMYLAAGLFVFCVPENPNGWEGLHGH